MGLNFSQIGWTNYVVLCTLGEINKMERIADLVQTYILKTYEKGYCYF